MLFKSLSLRYSAVYFLLLGVSLITKISFANTEGFGRVNMTGSIVETPCAIEVGDREQTLFMGNHPVSKIIREGQGPKKEFSIRLFGCTLTRLDPSKPDWKNFKVMFDGEEDKGHFKTSGMASGVALRISDHLGNVASPGVHLPERDLMADNMHLKYTLNLVGNQEILQAGDHQLTIRFRIDYN
ncbi:type 1 fimbrial protein [Erwinia sp. S63]|uniref:fimbrial protein n=1 Tax=Erwinia sp. S63 TaxID=2769341 RepID=UPI00190C5326|nr:fimbrial protein [Erwinia sp. S63]MBK0098545.1 type 1 fimbrial protein [Erwinia sp. S63]